MAIPLPKHAHCTGAQLAHGLQSATASRRRAGLMQWLVLALDVRRQRRALLALDERMLKDIGLSRADAAREALRTFSDIPNDLYGRR
jgi:uncharacterized protein YjiS (DUF1127 family)